MSESNIENYRDMQCKVSVIIPVYGVEKYIRKCLDSVVTQTLKDIEIICVNDCTLDNSFEIVKEYASKDPRFVLIEHEINQGQGIARNNAIAVARGECIGFVDPDDWIEPDMYQTMYDALKEHDADMVESLYFVNYEESSTVKCKKPLFRFPLQHSFNYQQINKKYPFSVSLGPCVKLYKSDFIRSNNIRFAEGTLMEDQIFAIKCRILANKIYFFRRNLYHYLIRKNSSSDAAGIPEKACLKIKLLDDIKIFLIQNGSYETLYDQFWEYAVNMIAYDYKAIPENYKNSFENYALQFIPEKYHSYYIYRKNKYYKNFGEKLFSVKNMMFAAGKFKILTILGIRIPLKKKMRGKN